MINSTSPQGTSSLISTDVASGYIRDWNWPLICFETYNISGCDYYSAGGAAQIYNMQLVDVHGVRV